MRRAAKTDTNHAEIVGALRDVGTEVLDLHTLPGGLDLLVGYRGVLSILEVKDGEKPKSRRKLTDAEKKTIQRFILIGCPVYVVENVDQALKAIGAIK